MVLSYEISMSLIYRIDEAHLRSEFNFRRCQEWRCINSADSQAEPPKARQGDLGTSLITEVSRASVATGVRYLRGEDDTLKLCIRAVLLQKATNVPTCAHLCLFTLVTGEPLERLNVVLR